MGRLKEDKHKDVEYTAGWWDFDSHRVCMAYWNNGTRTTRKFKFDWYFWLDIEDANRVAGTKFDLFVDRVERSDKHAKVYIPYYGDKRRKLFDWLHKKNVKPLEGDIHPVDRFIFDRPNVRLSVQPKILFWDLECDTRNHGWDAIEKHHIISVSYATGAEGKRHCILADKTDNRSEISLLDKFLDVISDHDVLVGWNTSAYDEEVLKSRCKVHKMNPNWRVVNFLDYMVMFKHPYFGYGRDSEGSGVKISYSLNNIARTLLGYGKIEGIPVHKLAELLEDQEGRDKIVEYNKRDVEIMQGLENKFGYIGNHAVLVQMCNNFLNDRSLLASKLVDGFIFRWANENRPDLKFPTKIRKSDKEYQELKSRSFKGAWVMQPVPGLHEGVCDLDFSSLYPSIVRSLNISPETKLGHAKDLGDRVDDSMTVAANGICFQKEPEGVFPAISRISMDSRDEFKELFRQLEHDGRDGTVEHRKARQRSDAFKVLANAAFGVASSPDTRYANPECGEAITTTGQAVMKLMMSSAKKKGIEGIYGDTDSGFLKCTSSQSDEFIRLFADELDDWIGNRNAFTGLMKVKLDAEFVRIFFTSKKRYAGKKTTGQWEIRGLEMIRTDNCKYVRDFQRQIVTMILESKTPKASVAESIVKKWARQLFEYKVGVDDLVVAQTLAMKLEDYDVETLHVRIARRLLEQGKEVYTGMKIPYVIVGKDKSRLQAVHLDEYDGKYDAGIYWKRQIWPPTKRILDTVFPKSKSKWEELNNYTLEGSKQMTLLTTDDEHDQDDEPVSLRIGPDCECDLETIKKIVDRYPGRHMLKLEIDTGDSIVDLCTSVSVSRLPVLVIEVEKSVGHKVYYGNENWDIERN